MVIRGNAVGWLFISVGLAFIAAMTMEPRPDLVEEVRSLPNTCLVCGPLGGQDVIDNVLLFVPLGIGLALAGLPQWKAVGIAFLITFAVESLQYTVIVGRHASLSDLVSNSAGGWLGFTLGKHWRGLLLPSRRQARWLAGLGMCAWLAIQMGSALLLSIAAPNGNYFGGWAPRLRNYDQFGGTVLSAALDGAAIPPQVSDGTWLRAHFHGAARFALQVVAIGNGATSWLAPIVGIFYGNENELFVLGQSGQDLIFRVRTRAGDLRLRSPALRLPNALAAVPGKRLELEARRDQGRLFLQLALDGHEQRRELAISPSWGWSFLIPFDYAFGSEVHALTMLWIAGLLAPIAHWTRRTVNTGRGKWGATLVLAILVGLGLGVVPVIAHLPVAHWSEWLAAAVGLGVGWWLSGVRSSAVAQARAKVCTLSSGQR